MDKRTVLPIVISILLSAALVGWAFNEVSQPSVSRTAGNETGDRGSNAAIVLPIGDIGPVLAKNGAIDARQWEKFYAGRPEAQGFVTMSREELTVTEETADVVLNLL